MDCTPKRIGFSWSKGSRPVEKLTFDKLSNAPDEATTLRLLNAIDFLTNDNNVIRDLEALPLIKDVFKPLSEKIIALKVCFHQDCSRSCAFTDWGHTEIKDCDQHQATSIKCRILRHIQKKILNPPSEENV